MKKSISIILLFIMLISIIVVSPIHANAKTIGEYKYSILDDGSAKIIEYKGSESKVIVPAELDGIKVSEIGSFAFGKKTKLKSVRIPNGINKVGECAFVNCKKLAKVKFSSSVKYIGDYAFWYCSSFKKITLPKKLKEIGSEAFLDCGYYNNEKNWKNNTLYIGKYLIKVRSFNKAAFSVKKGTKLIAGYALSGVRVKNNKRLKKVIIPNSVKYINHSAFSNLGKLKKVKFGNGVKEIGEGAFVGCESIKNIKFPNSLTTICWHAFSCCSALTEITFPDSVKSIGYSSFFGCPKLKKIRIGKGIKEIGYGSFGAFEKNGKRKKVKGLVFYGYSGTDTERYAKENKYIFVSI